MGRKRSTHCRTCGDDLESDPILTKTTAAGACATCQRIAALRCISVKNGKAAPSFTKRDVQGFLSKFGGVCMICEAAKATSMDHCHITGRLRGLLCHNCNVGLGHFRDSPALLSRAIVYIEEGEAQ